ncbi:BTB/POZ domain-containing protein 18 isoform X3 [Crotalus tigris]|nr:BTB/POZ domain-containing protein 18 isoform X3 [Crotalus tigris]XP_039197152.1 BTB/POZ domain-containing protein 18 isoform X3 [Crotalus tigris]XP_039197153.1 BTB/POZ domain-containing protein 18 isoform X3 [Crotalus tigris]XP_039197154.1 BTB/POZ domain-containing protein 18 isoform X3 [Crotalus tigris]
MKEGSVTMTSSAANPKILYRNSRLLRMVFLQLHRQQRADLFCDVVLQAEGEAVPAHCCILSACSPFFTEQLEREMPPKGHKVVLEIRGLKIGTLRKLVDFLYTSEMEVSREEAQDILAAARQLQVSELDSLQLEGGKLVKKTLGRRLNRNCLQITNPMSTSETSLIHSSAPSGGSLTSWLAAGKQATSSNNFISCSKEISSHNSTDQKDLKKQKLTTALLSSDKQISKGQTITADPQKTKVKKRPAGTIRNIMANNENGGLHRKETETGETHTRAGLQTSKKIKLSRPKLSFPPLSTPCATKDHCTVTSSKSPRSVRRLWRQKCPGKDETKKEDSIHFCDFRSPPLLPKSKGRKRIPSDPTPCPNCPQEIGHIGRVKLRKVINGSCWEVVHESPAVQPTVVANGVRTLKDEGSQSQIRHPKPEVADVQQLACSAKLLPATAEAAPAPDKSVIKQQPELPEKKVALDEGADAAENHYDLEAFVLDHLVKEEQYDSLASAGELEQMLDLLLADEDATEGIQSTTITQSLCASPQENENVLGNIEIEEKERCCTVGPQLDKIKITEACDSTNGSSLLDPVLNCLPLVTPEPNGECLSLSRSASPQLGDWATAQCQLSESTNGTAKCAEPLSVTWTGDEDQGPLTYDMGISDTKSLTEAVLSNPVQHNLDCKLPSFLDSLEEETIDIGGVEDLFLNIECVRPDPSPISETEVDVLNYFFTEKCIQVQ